MEGKQDKVIYYDLTTTGMQDIDNIGYTNKPNINRDKQSNLIVSLLEVSR